VSVLQRKELEDSPLADLHAIASELGLESYRALRREDLIAAILEAQGGEGGAEVEEAAAFPEEDAGPEEDVGPEDEAGDEAAAEETAEEPPPAAEALAPEPEPAAAEPEGPAGEEEPEVVEEPITEEETAGGVLDILPNGSGFVRVDGSGQSRDDVYISPAQIRRCELRAGDEVAGPVRQPRRNERHPSLVRVETVNGADAEPPEQRPHFDDLTPVFPTDRLTPPAGLEEVPFGKGSRVGVSGPPGAGATTLLRQIVSTLAERHPELALAVVLAGVRPEEVTEWAREAGAPVSGGSFDRSSDTQAQAAELAVERAKRAVERGRDAALVVDSLEALPAATARRVFGAARKLEEGGSLTVLASIGTAPELQRFASTRIVLEPPESGGAPTVSATRSGALRADLLTG
jgi:transcription termination factor Rho